MQMLKVLLECDHSREPYEVDFLGKMVVITPSPKICNQSVIERRACGDGLTQVVDGSSTLCFVLVQGSKALGLLILILYMTKCIAFENLDPSITWERRTRKYLSHILLSSLPAKMQCKASARLNSMNSFPVDCLVKRGAIISPSSCSSPCTFWKACFDAETRDGRDCQFGDLKNYPGRTESDRCRSI
jgi:hypothetical protein